MSEFKLCENGHYFPQNIKDCPYCPKPTGTNIKKDIENDLNLGNNFGKTQVFGGGGFGGKMDNPKENESDFGGMFGNNNTNNINNNLNRTQIFGGGNQVEPNFFGNASPFKAEPASQGRKLVGWLVSFTIDVNGIDFHLYEGRNLIGGDGGCDIVVQNDRAVSSRHLTILHRMGQFKFKDEFSTNGTFINDVFVEEGNLNDGDVIRIGDTVFKFRSIA